MPRRWGLPPWFATPTRSFCRRSAGGESMEGFNAGPDEALAAFAGLLADVSAGNDPFTDIDMSGSIWPGVRGTADRYNQPGIFTAMTGFEWTSQPGGDNLHRIVVFADGADKDQPCPPVLAVRQPGPRKLWDYMENYETSTGGRVFAHVHNGNLSNGLAFTAATFDGTPMDADYAARRARWEPIMEITQIKGDGETHPYLSPDDEFADFEHWDVGNLDGSAPKTPRCSATNMAVRAPDRARGRGEGRARTPTTSGFNGTPHSHTGLALRAAKRLTSASSPRARPRRFDNGGLFPAADPSLRIITATGVGVGPDRRLVARKHPRRDLRRAYAQGNLRDDRHALRVRLFAGWDFKRATNWCPTLRPGLHAAACRWADDSTPRPRCRAHLHRPGDARPGLGQPRPRPDHQGLDRRGRTTRERIYDVAVSDGREIGPDGRARERSAARSTLRPRPSRTPLVPRSFLHPRDPDFDPRAGVLLCPRAGDPDAALDDL